MTLKKIVFAICLSSSLLSNSLMASPVLTPIDYDPSKTSNAWVEIDEAAFLRNFNDLKR